MIVFLSEVKEGAGNCGVVGYEPTVEIGKAKEGSYVLDFDGGWPGGDAVEFYWVHGELTGFHDHSEVFDFWDIELALLELQVKVEFRHMLEDTTGLF